MSKLEELAEVSSVENGLSEIQIEHLYITLAMRLRDCDSVVLNPKKLAFLYQTCPYLLGRDGRRGPLPHIERLYCASRSQLKLQEQFWHYQMEGSYGRSIAAKIKLFIGACVVLNGWILYRRVSFYMEHSFDLAKPNINYLVHRF